MSYLLLEVPKMHLGSNSLQGAKLQQVEDIGGRDGLEMWVTFFVSGKGKLVLFNPTYDRLVSNEDVVVIGIGDCLLVGGHIAEMPFNEIIKNYQQVYDSAQKKLNSC